MYKVTLSAVGNIDHGENPFINIVNGKEIKCRVAERSSIEACQTAARMYIEGNDLGAGNWDGGRVYDENNQYIGYISYNGKFWDKETEYGMRAR